MARQDYRDGGKLMGWSQSGPGRTTYYGGDGRPIGYTDGSGKAYDMLGKIIKAGASALVAAMFQKKR